MYKFWVCVCYNNTEIKRGHVLGRYQGCRGTQEELKGEAGRQWKYSTNILNSKTRY